MRVKLVHLFGIGFDSYEIRNLTFVLCPLIIATAVEVLL